MAERAFCAGLVLETAEEVLNASQAFLISRMPKYISPLA